MAKKSTKNKAGKKSTSKKEGSGSGKKSSVKKKTVNKSSNKKNTNESKVKVSVNSTDDYEKELKNIDKKPFFNFDMHPFALASLIIVLILFISAAILAYFSFNSTVDAVLVAKNDSSDNKDNTIIIKDPSTEIADEINKEQRNSCKEVSFNVVCGSEYPGNSCSYINDNNLSSQWMASASCTSGKKPCSVLNYITVSSENNFSKVKLWNRVEKDYYINRVSLTYNNISEDYRYGGQNYTKTPWVIELKEPASAVEIKIVEIVGIGRNYLSGISEIELYKKGCKNP
ncbi:MAG: hypothetical protein ACQER9_00395 [Nanobdellota archaeon]